MGLTSSATLRTELSLAEVRAALPLDEDKGFDGKPVYTLKDTGSVVSVFPQTSQYDWEHRFGIAYNVIVVVSHAKDERVDLANASFDAQVGRLVAAATEGWIEHHDMPVVYWTEDNGAVVNTNYQGYETVAGSLRDFQIAFKLVALDFDAE